MPEERIGVYICHCGTNIAKVVDVHAVAEAAMDFSAVASACTYKYMCSNPGQEMIAEDIRKHGLTRVVVAACSPRMHEATFRKALERGGINPYMLEMANIREQCSWIHVDGAIATEKAKSLARGAVKRVIYHEPLERRSVAMCPATLVVGGGITGLTTALELADADQQVYLVERKSELGGNVARIDLTAPYLDSARDILRDCIARVESHPRIRVFLECELAELKGFVGNFRPSIRKHENETFDLEVGSVVVCTGYKEFDASRIEPYGYGRLPDVITSFELEAMLRNGRVETKDGRRPRYVSIIHCVGSRSATYHSYCSRVCCASALKYGHAVKSAIPEARVTDLYIDIRAFGKGCEEFYKKSAEAKTMFLMYGKNELPAIRMAGAGDDCNLLITVDEKLSGEEIEIPADMVVLMVGMEPREDADQVARTVNISRDKDGWFIESHPKLDPVATTTDGVFIAGACQYPKDIPDSVSQARAAAARILARIAQGQIAVEAIYSEVMPHACAGCRTCNDVCPYGAIEFDESKQVSTIIGAVCKAWPVPWNPPLHWIDEKIKELGDWRGKTLAKVREIIHEADPEIVEEWKWMGTPVFSHGGIVCTGETYKNVVKMTFAKGAAH
jgi:heterodisulfide reductase subunit A2